MNLQGFIGVGLFILVGYALSSKRSAIKWRLIGAGILLQFIIAVSVLHVRPVVIAFDAIAVAVTRVISFADKGVDFIFGQNISNPAGPWGFIFAVKVLPIIIFFCSLMTVLYHLGIMQRVVAGVAWVLRRSLGITGAEALSASANIFVGQTEAPLVVKPYIAGMTRSQLMCVMVGGFATIAGSVMAAYIGMLGDAYAQALGITSLDGRELFAKHLLTASIMSAPAGIVMAKLMLPETETPRPETIEALMTDEKTTTNIVDAAASGASEGLKLALNVAAMLIAFVALLALIDWPLTALSDYPPVAQWRASLGLPSFSLRSLLGIALSPVAWCVGVPWAEANRFAGLLGTQIVATEFVAYSDLAAGMKDKFMSLRSAEMATYALCGFANIASIGIQIGGLSALAPERRSDLAALAPRAMLAGALACWMTAAVAGIVM